MAASQSTPFFPYPSDTNIEPILVPFLIDFDYDFTVPQAFASFPRHCGFHDPTRPGGIDIDRPERELAAFLQTWLFFGLISELVGHAIDRSDFVRKAVVNDREIDVIDPRLDTRLEELLLERYRLLIKYDYSRAEAIQDDIIRNISLAQECLIAIEQAVVPARSTLAHVTLSVRLLLSFARWTAMLGTRIAFCNGSIPDNPVVPNTWMDYHSFPLYKEDIKLAKLNDISQQVISKNDLSAQLLSCRMRDNGWCPQRIKSALGAALGYPVLYYISSIRRRTSGLTNHQHCSEDGCVASNMLENRLTSSHIAINCECMDIKPPILEVVHIIQAGGIPLVRVRRLPMGQIEIDIIPCTASSRYVAISHVWSDGQLGSTQNALPHCRLGCLDQLISGLPRSSGRGLRLFYSLHNKIHNLLWRCKLASYPSNFEGLFWLDTLCIPMGQGHEQVRKKAINMMDLVYSSADRVLVLDSGLQQVSGGSQEILANCEGLFGSNSSLRSLQVPEHEKFLEVLANVYSSNWMGRAWTYQEGFLARDSVIQLRDSFIFFSLMDFRVYKNAGQYLPSYKLCKGSRITVLFLYPFRAVRSLLTGDSNKTISSRIAEILYTGFCIMGRAVLMPFLIVFGSSYGMGVIDCFMRSCPQHPETLREMMCDVLHHAIHSQDVTTSWRDTFFAGQFGQWEIQKRYFIRTWNSLLSRSTTKPEDLPIIVANMTGFNATHIAESDDAGERMRAILFSLTLLPMDLLFINGPKYADGSDHTDRWIPRAPCDEPLARNVQMQYTHDGIVLDVGYTRNYSVFMLDPFTRRARQFCLTTSPATTNYPLWRDSKPYWIKALAPTNDKLPEIPEAETCLILDCKDQDYTTWTDESRVIRGARMLVVKKSENKIYLQYDCAIRATRGSSFSEPDQNSSTPAERVPDIRSGLCPRSTWTIVHAKRVPIESEMILQHSCSTSRPFYPLRPANPTSFDQPWILWFSGIGAIIPFIGLSKLAAWICQSVSGTRAQTPFQFVAGILLVYAGLPLSVLFLRYMLRILADRVWRATFEEGWMPNGKYWWWWRIASLLGWRWSV